MIPPLAVVFDLDGTLIDSRGDIVAATNYALLSTGRAALPAQVIVRFVGDGARSLLSRAAKVDDNTPELEDLLARFLDYYIAHPIDFTRWMDGALEALEALSNMPEMAIALCTNKPRVTTNAVLRSLGVEGMFRAVVAGGDLPHKKPSREPLLHLARVLSVPPEAVVMVGDGPQDVESARAAGMRSVAVEGGFCSAERVRAARPDVMLRSLRELSGMIQRWCDSTARVTPKRVSPESADV